MARKSETSSVLFTVYYDGACAAWRTRIAIYKMEARRAELAIAWCDVSEDPEALEAHGIRADDARSRLHIVDADGTLLAGADAFALLWSALPGYRRLGRLAASPGFNALAHALHDCAASLQRLRRSFRRRGAHRPKAPAEGRVS